MCILKGLREKVHPYAFVAQHGFQELLEVPDAGDKARPLMAKIVPLLKVALVSKGAWCIINGKIVLLFVNQVDFPQRATVMCNVFHQLSSAHRHKSVYRYGEMVL